MNNIKIKEILDKHTFSKEDIEFLNENISEITDPEYAFKYARKIIKGKCTALEHIIAQDPFWSYYYASNVIEERWEEAEPIISTMASVAYGYAKYVIKGAFELGEAAIAKESDFSYFYASEVIHRRFELGEAAIAQDPDFAYCYAKYVIKGPFELGEAAIATSAGKSCNYAFDILNNRFLLGEPTILKADNEISRAYIKYFPDCTLDNQDLLYPGNNEKQISEYNYESVNNIMATLETHIRERGTKYDNMNTNYAYVCGYMSSFFVDLICDLGPDAIDAFTLKVNNHTK